MPDAPAAAVEAVRIGGRLTGEAALETYGIWVDPAHRVEIVVRPNANELRRPGDRRARRVAADRGRWRVFWSDVAPSGETWWVTIEQALGHLLATADRLTAIRCIDSALNRAKNGSPGIDEAGLARVFAAAPRRVQAWRDDVDGRAESGGETQARLLCRDNGLEFEPQIEVPGVGRLDGRIGPHSYVEVDGERWHDTESSFRRDRERDVASTIRGDRVLRLSYPLLRTDPARCLAAMVALVERDRRESAGSKARRKRRGPA
ncbi:MULTISPECIES: hypothetical protein [unclassified Leifsonia]|uniref:hypothetical protein n=1 Tax=unclassified Leifsonia TaxID=2663824 RepID=UPI0012FAF2DA|nr:MULTISPECIES: hypothetical protein [unclassified Leifsonia]